MLSLEQVIKKLEDRKLNMVAKATGVSYQTVWKVATRKTVDVSYAIVEKLSNYFEGENK